MRSATLLRMYLFALAMLVSGVIYAQPALLALQNVTFEPANPDDYEPFTVTVTFSKPYCIADSPMFSKASLVGNLLTLQLSHLGDGPCALRRSFNVPGLPGGEFAVNVAVTGVYQNVALNARETVVAEGGTYALRVGLTLPVKYNMGKIYTTQFDGVYVLNRGPDGTSQFSYDASTITGFADAEFTAYTGLGLGRIGVPNSAIHLWQLRYPSPLVGSFATTSENEKNRLSTQGFSWFGGGLSFYVLPLVNGACPLGAVPVYRLFNPRAPAHRYVSSLDTYNTLAANGFIGEGMVFCAPRP